MKLIALAFGLWLAVSLLFGLVAGKVLRGFEENNRDLPNAEPSRSGVVRFHNSRAG